jgi:hypothetical protein
MEQPEQPARLATREPQVLPGIRSWFPYLFLFPLWCGTIRTTIGIRTTIAITIIATRTTIETRTITTRTIVPDPDQS